MKKTVLLISLFFATIAMSQKNIIKNGGFEKRTGEPQADDWVTESGITRSKKIKYKGEYSMQLASQSGFTFTISQSGYTDADLQSFVPHKVKPNTTYTLTYWVMDNTDKATLKHKVRWKNEDGDYIASKSELSSPKNGSTNNSKWKKITATAKSPAGAKEVSVFFYAVPEKGSGQSVYLDEVKFYEVEKASINKEVLDKNTVCYYNSKTKRIKIEVRKNLKIEEIAIYDITGKKLFKTNKTENKMEIPIQTKTEVTIVNIKTNKGMVTKKIIINK